MPTPTAHRTPTAGQAAGEHFCRYCPTCRATVREQRLTERALQR